MKEEKKYWMDIFKNGLATDLIDRETLDKIWSSKDVYETRYPELPLYEPAVFLKQKIISTRMVPIEYKDFQYIIRDDKWEDEVGNEEVNIPDDVFDNTIELVNLKDKVLYKFYNVRPFMSERTITKENKENVKLFTRDILMTGFKSAELIDVIDDHPLANSYLFNISVLVCLELFLDILDSEKIPIKELNCYEEKLISILWDVHLTQIDFEDYTFVFEILDEIRELIKSNVRNFDTPLTALITFLKYIHAFIDLNSIIFRVYDIFSKDETLSKLIDFDFSEIIDDDKKDVRFFIVMENITQELVKHNLTFVTFSTYFKEV